MAEGGAPLLRVDYAALHTLATTIDEQAQTATGVSTQLASPEATVQATVDEALARFHPAWLVQIALLGQATAGLAQAIELGAAGFQDTDTALAGGTAPPAGPG